MLAAVRGFDIKFINVVPPGSLRNKVAEMSVSSALRSGKLRSVPAVVAVLGGVALEVGRHYLLAQGSVEKQRRAVQRSHHQPAEIGQR